LVRVVLYGLVIMSTYDRLISRHRSALRIEKAFIVAVGIIASAMAQIAF
jgi:hypothetical protein